MKTRFLSILTLAAALVGAEAMALPSGQASAQEVQVTGPLAGAPAVHHMRVYRQNRLQIAPVLGITLREPYRQSMVLGMQLQYFLTDWLGIGVWGAYTDVGFDTNLTNNIQSQGVTTERNQLSLPSRGNFPKQVGQITGIGALQMTFVPLRGKLALFQRLFVDTDFYIFGGLGFVGLQERSNIAASTCTDMAMTSVTAQNDCFLASQTARSNRMALSPTFGAGLTMYFVDWFGIAVEWRGFYFKMNDAGFDVLGGGPGGDFPDGVVNSKDREGALTQMFNLALVFHLPSRARISD